MREFGEEQTIFDDMDVLNPNKGYRPRELPEREMELDELHSALRPATLGSTPLNVFVYGPTGQGKTAAINLKTHQLQSFADNQGIDVTVVNVKCKGLDKSYHLLTHLVKELRGPGAELPKGHQKKALFQMVTTELRRIGGTIIVILDEIDAIGDDDYVLYELPRLELDDVRLSIIGITNDLQFRENLNADVRSSLGEDEIEFSPYNANQLRAILARRAAKGLKDTEFVDRDSQDSRPTVATNGIDGKVLVSDVLEPDVIPLAAAFAAADSGDARQAIKLLFRACRLADDAGEQFVTEQHVRDARDYIERRAVERGINSLPTHAKIALMAVTYYTVRDDATWVETNKLYDYHKQICAQYGVESLSDRRYREKLNNLSHSNILKKKTTGRGQGKGVTNRYSLAVGIETAIENLPNSEDRLGGGADVIRDMA
ncbi:Cdc6/Cdc18 family protein [Haloferax profundi]|uniref:ORC1-type DNA replication protein n=1 Tax=Haloferax profundi TaxID=1544718 RepID=A0A0W1RGH4_9EURY|nr:AAA family ATPase [Haloferax profundi]KTG12603.1 cell division control protein Cdc6 [Haloferax profundi]